MSATGFGAIAYSDTVESDLLLSVLNATRTSILVFNAQGELVIANQPAADLLDMSLTPYLGRHFAPLLFNVLKRGAMERMGVSGEELLSLLRELKLNPFQTFRRHLACTVDGTSCVLLIASIPLPGERGALTGRLVMACDVTQQARNERFRAEVIGMVVHDLRSPLNVVLGNLQLVQEMLGDDTGSGDVANAVNVASRAAEGMLQLVESMLDTCKLEAGKLRMNLEPVSLQDITAEAMVMVEELARQGNLSMEARIGQDVPLVMADQGMLQRVLVNLLDNAVRFTPDGGQVRIEAAPGDRFVEVRVIDTGPGVPAAAHERVFERYVQTDNPPVRGHKGSGLGLAFCQLAIEAHGGTMWVSEGPEGGAMFVFTLPTDPDASMLVLGNGH